MTEDTFSWASLGNTSPQNAKILQLLETIPVLMRDNKMELQSNIAQLRTDVRTEITNIHSTIGDLKAEVRTMNQNFMLDSRKALSNDYDDRSVSTFMSLDELNLEPPKRPVEEEEEDDEPLMVADEIRIVEDGFTAPVPEEVVESDPIEDMSDEDVAAEILQRIEAYIEENGVLMNFSMKKKGIVPKDFVLNKGVKELMKASVKLEDSKIRLYKLDKMRGMYHMSDIVDPQSLYDEAFN
tara:strand:+ start:523 stop:1239 length:717 start_codon:yes stop_codon:yes gene_type:complete